VRRQDSGNTSGMSTPLSVSGSVLGVANSSANDSPAHPAAVKPVAGPRHCSYRDALLSKIPTPVPKPAPKPSPAKVSAPTPAPAPAPGPRLFSYREALLAGRASAPRSGQAGRQPLPKK
jgi:hypothetical protein